VNKIFGDFTDGKSNGDCLRECEDKEEDKKHGGFGTYKKGYLDKVNVN